MPSLRQVLGVLRRAGVGPEEIFISEDVLRDIIQQVKQILSEDEQEDSLSSEYA